MRKVALLLLQIIGFSLVFPAPRDPKNGPHPVDSLLDSQNDPAILGEDSSDDLGIAFNLDSLGDNIIGGVDIDITACPYQLSLQSADRHVCGAVLLSPNWAITSAHCTIELYGYEMIIRAGSNTTTKGGQSSKVTKVVYHPDYDSDTDSYDVSILGLDKPIITYFDTAKPARLPKIGDKIKAGSLAVITGWGITEEDETDPAPHLQAIRVPVTSQEDCRNAYPDRVITADMFCAGFLEIGGQDSCKGDSGGPVTIDGTLAGLVSWGMGCGDPGHPGVNTNVYVIRSWIKEVTGL